MKAVRVALAQIAPRLGDLKTNLATHLDAASDARTQGADVVVFPELSLTGYMLEDMVPEVAIRPARCQSRSTFHSRADLRERRSRRSCLAILSLAILPKSSTSLMT